MSTNFFDPIHSPSTPALPEAKRHYADYYSPLSEIPALNPAEPPLSVLLQSEESLQQWRQTFYKIRETLN